MPKVSEEHRLAKHEEILDAALRAFSRKGFQATSMAEIIAESGMSAGAIYGHFEGKYDIVRGVATMIVSATIVDLETLVSTEPMPEPMAAVRSLIDSFMQSNGWPAILLQVWGDAVTDAGLREVCRDSYLRIRQAFTRYLARWQREARGVSEGEADRVATEQAPLFIAAVFGFVVQDSLFAEFDRTDYLTKSLSYLPK